MLDELQKLREITETLTGNGYLNDQAEEWKGALNAIPECVYIADTKLHIRFINKALSERLNKSLEDVYDQPCCDIIFGEETDFDNTCPLDSLYLSKLNGWFSITKSPITNYTGRIIGYIYTLQDVTIELKALRDLEERERTLVALFNAAPIGIGLTDSETRIIVTINDYLLNLVGYSREDLIGCSTETLYLDREEFLRVGASIKSSAAGDAIAKLKTKSGTILDVYIRSSAVGRRNLLVFTVLDLTEKYKQDALIKLNDARLDATLELGKMHYNSSEEAVIKFTLEKCVSLTNSTYGYLHFIKNGASNLTWVSHIDYDSFVTKVLSPAEAIDMPWEECICSKEPVVCNGEEECTHFTTSGTKVNRYLCIPVIINDELVAVVGVSNKKDNYDSTDIKQLTVFMHNMWEIINKRQNFEKKANTSS